MRLTLRTMLAYMDGILEPSDAEDIAKKIEESETATKIYHRIRDVMRRLRLAAPGLTDRGAGLDANTVAEYLDNCLPGDRVPDFEKVCLESDIHLAEVASSHQILALVLGEAAEIDPASRQRMYELPQVAAETEARDQKAAEAALAAASPGNWAADEAAAERKARLKPTVPEYLREPRRKLRILPTAVVLTLAGCLVGLILRATGQFEPGSLLARWTGFTTARPDDAEQPPAGQAEQAESSAAPSKSSSAMSEHKGEHIAEHKTSGKTAAPDGVGETAAPDEPAKTAVLPPPSPASVAKAVATSASTAPATLPTLPKIGAAGLAVPAGGANPGSPEVALASTAVKSPANGGELKAMPPLPGGEVPVPPEPPPVPRLGRFLYEEPAVLLKFDPHDASWQPLAIEEPTLARQVLLALPTTRPKVALNAAATLEMVGGTQLQLLSGDDKALGDLKAAVGIELPFGRVVLKSRGAAAVRLAIVVAGHSGVLTLSDSETIAALEVTPIHAAGSNPESEALQVATQLFVPAGDALWEETGGQKPIEIKSPGRVDILGPLVEEVEPIGSKDHEWIEAEPLGPLDRQALVAMSQLLPPGRSASLGLMELTEHRRKEFRWLATRCLGYLGRFEPMLLTLEDPTRKLEWFDYVEQLRQAVARGPETASAVRKAAEKHFNEEARAWFRMLWGYTDKNLQDGSDDKLVRLLEHENLAFRVLAFWNLHDITGLSLYYKPEQTAAKRQQSILHWKQRQMAGQIRVKTVDVRPPVGGKSAESRP